MGDSDSNQAAAAVQRRGVQSERTQSLRNGFDQRFSAALAPDGFDGLWQVAEVPGDWRDDLRVTYTRRG